MAGRSISSYTAKVTLARSDSVSYESRAAKRILQTFLCYCIQQCFPSADLTPITAPSSTCAWLGVLTASCSRVPSL